MAQRDLIISFLSSVPLGISGMYMERPLQIVCPVTQAGGGGYPGGRAGYQQWLSRYGGSGALIPGLFKGAGGQSGDTIGRVCVMGFSNGCIGVDEVLRASDSNKIDTVLAIDGVHGSWAYSGNDKVLSPPNYKRYLNHAAHVVHQSPDAPGGAPVMVITHSAIDPIQMPSTTETADLIWKLAWEKAPQDVLTLFCDFNCPPIEHIGALTSVAWTKPKQICSSVSNKCYKWSGLADGWPDRRVANNLFVLGWGDKRGEKIVTRDPAGTADHIFQSQVVLAEMLKEFTVKRWNASCGVVATAGVGQAELPTACTPGQGVVYDEAGGGKYDYFPDLPEYAAPQPTCPAPPAGYMIVGGNGPCTMAPEPPPPPQVSTRRERDADLSTRVLAAFAGAAAGFAGLRYVVGALRRR